MRRTLPIPGVILALLFGLWPGESVPATRALSPAQGRHVGRGHRDHDRDRDDEDRDEDRDRESDEHQHHQGSLFAAQDRDIIREYFRNPPSGLPPGLAKRGGNLPPGLEKHLERNGTLPPGLQKRLTPLPADLERQLPPLPSGCHCKRGIIGANVVILNTRTGRIWDIMYNVLVR